MTAPDKVVAGGAGHWYALIEDPQYGDTLVGLPMMADDDPASLPPHPSATTDPWGTGGWYEITDPADDCDDEALIAELKGE